MERRSRKADGLARSLSRAGGINETGGEGGLSPLAAAFVQKSHARAWRRRKLVFPKRPRALALDSLPPPDHSTSRHHESVKSTKPPIAPARRETTPRNTSQWPGTSWTRRWAFVRVLGGAATAVSSLLH